MCHNNLPGTFTFTADVSGTRSPSCLCILIARHLLCRRSCPMDKYSLAMRRMTSSQEGAQSMLNSRMSSRIFSKEVAGFDALPRFGLSSRSFSRDQQSCVKDTLLQTCIPCLSKLSRATLVPGPNECCDCLETIRGSPSECMLR